ncbi:MAG TPA: 16S rRNA (guanine(966)-N(2))-methyltransferase RsmD [Bacillota bacterium]|nr:16S rRNA (guanine(966)-N(2))-methyltransferase RsmD [Bacillota bacterium]
MRIISGKYGGRKITMDEKAPVRPTSDKARGALFSSVAAVIPGSRFLDVCAGTGAVGIEALSRGALHVTAIEQSQRVVGLLRQNAGSLGIDDSEFEILQGDFRRVLANMPGRTFDVIFIDPPYEQGLSHAALEQVSGYGLLADGGVMIVEHFAKEELPAACAGLVQFKIRKYGQTVMTYYRKGEMADE